MSRRILLTLEFCALAAVVAASVLWPRPGPAEAQVPDSPWPMFQHDAQRSGRSPLPGPQEANLKWTFPAEGEGPGFSYPVVGGDGTIYVRSPSGLYAVDEKGVQRWLNGDAIGNPILAPDGRIYMVSNVYPYSLVVVKPDGTLDGEYDLGGYPQYGEPVIDGLGRLYYVADCAVPGDVVHFSLVRLDPDGSTSWLYDIEDRTTYPGAVCGPPGSSSDHEKASAPALDTEGNVYFVYGPGVFSTDSDGNERWRRDVERPCNVGSCYVAVSPAGLIYAAVSGNNGEPSYYDRLLWADVYALTAEGSVARIYYQAGREGPYWWRAPAVGSDGTLYLVRWHYGYISPVLTLMAMEPDGTLGWSNVVSYGGTIGAPVVAGDGVVYLRAEGLRAYAPDGTLKWTAPVSTHGQYLAIGPNETLYVTGPSNVDKLYAFGPGQAAGFCLPYANEDELRDEPRVDCRSTFVLDAGIGSLMSRDLLLQHADLFTAKGWTMNFLWYAPETTLEVPGGDPRTWSYCVRDSPRDGAAAACRVENIRPAFSISELFGGQAVTLHMFAYDDPDDSAGPAFISRACGNYSKIRTEPVPKISGYKFEDLNADGVWQQGSEPPVRNWPITLYDPDGSAYLPQYTRPDGYYEFSITTRPGTYELVEGSVLDWVPTTPQTLQVDIPEGAGDTNHGDNNFGNQQATPTSTSTNTPTSTPTPTPTPTKVTINGTPVKVGGFQAPLETAQSSGSNAVLPAGVAGAVAASIAALGGAAWYARRRLG